MRKVKIPVVVVFCTVLLAACGGTAIRVTHQPQDKGTSTPLDGIPFYTKAVACKHETVWSERTYRLTLVATQTEKIRSAKDQEKRVTLFSISKEISQEVYSTGFQTVKQRINTYDSGEEEDVNKIRTEFDGLRAYTPPTIDNDKEFSFTTDRFTLVSNQNEPVIFVNYSDPHYFNAKIPLVGSVNPDISLGPDLTLSKASVNIQEQTLKTFLDMLPVKEILTGVGKAALLVGEEIPSVRVQLTIEPNVYKYTLSKLEKGGGKLPCDEPKGMLNKVGGKNESDRATFSRVQASTDESKKKEDGGNTIKFSGSVDLPKSQPQSTESKSQPKGK